MVKSFIGCVRPTDNGQGTTHNALRSRFFWYNQVAFVFWLQFYFFMSSTSEQDISAIHKLLTDRSVPPKDEHLSGVESGHEAISKLYDDILAIRETLFSFARGDFDIQLAGRGAIWGHLKALQANLKHLTWQVEQIAAGDLTQRVDFMGDFSTAFNKMVLQLEDSLERMKEREAAERTQIMLDATPLSCSVWDEQYKILDCNLEAIKLFGLTSKQEYLERFYELSPKYQPDGRHSAEVIREHLRQAFENGHVQCEFFRQTPEGDSIPTELTLVRVWQKNQHVVAAYSRDLRELKQKQEALDKQRLLLLDVINTSPICFMVLVNGEIQFSSAFTQHLLGLNVGRSFVSCFADQVHGANLLAAVKKDIHIEWKPVTIQSVEHGVKEMLANLFLTDYFGKQGVIVWLIDITELKRIEADLRTAKETAEHLGRAKDEFIANMSHELRTPMNAVLGIIYLLHHTNLSEEQISYVGTMEESAKSLLHVINDVLDFSSIESGKVFIKSEEFELQQTLANVQNAFQETANAKNLSLSHSIDDNVPDKIVGDSHRLQQVLTILVDNALKFTNQGSVRIHVQLESSENDNVTLRFSVQDTGVGVNIEDKERIFRAFVQGDTSGTRKYGGVGLGLTVAKSLVEVMKGQIRCESEIRQGSVFHFTVVFGLPKDTTEASIITEAFQKLPILLVEDNKINQIVATKMLQAKGCLVDVAANGLKAVEMVRLKEYALVLMDVQMPEMDGIRATQLIRSDKKFKSLPIVALTANAMEDDRQRCLEAGMNDHLAKPIEPRLLYQAILKWAKM